MGQKSHKLVIATWKLQKPFNVRFAVKALTWWSIRASQLSDLRQIARSVAGRLKCLRNASRERFWLLKYKA